MTSIGNDVDQRRMVILFGNGRFVHSLGHQVSCLNGANVQAHSKADPLAGDRPLQKHRFPVQRLVARYDNVGQLVHALISFA